MERTLELDIPVLLPNVQDVQDQCVARLQNLMANKRGILNAHLELDHTPVQLCVHYDPELVSIDTVQTMAQTAGAQIERRYHHDILNVEGMDCSDCVSVIEHGIGRMDGVLNVSVSYPAQKMRVEYDSQVTNRGAIEKRLRGLGYAVPAGAIQSFYREQREIIFSLTAGILVLIGWLGEAFFGLNAYAAIALYLGAYALAGWDISRHAFHALRERRFDTDLLMVTAAIGAALIGEFFEGALLLFLFSLGHALEERALDRARAAVRALGDLTPKTALVRRNGRELEVPVAELQLNELVIVRPGVRIPVDGTVLTGASAVNQAPVTGESVPVDKVQGDKVFAGTINGEGALEVSVTRLAKDSTLARVLQLVEEAQTSKSPTQQTIERFERVFVPSILGMTLLVIVAPPLLGFLPLQESFLRAMVLLVAASPCALALGTPASILAGVAQAARNGVLVKGGVHLENLGRLQAIAFDKTGTLTHGRPEVTDVEGFVETDKSRVLSLAASLESRSAHPLAQAIVRAAQVEQITPAPVENLESITGKGLRGSVKGQTVLVGNLNLLTENKITVPDAAQARIQSLQDTGKTVVLVAAANTPLGLLALADVRREQSPAVMHALKQLGIAHTIMLTGDNERVAANIARQVGVTDVRADLSPEDEFNVIRDLTARYGAVGMVGDGVNDAPALAHATVGIAMGGAGTDVALETADVALMGDDLSKLPFAVGLGRATRNVIIQNLVISLGVIAFLILSSLIGFVGLGIAIIFHEGSTLVVVANALRLLGYKNT